MLSLYSCRSSGRGARPGHRSAYVSTPLRILLLAGLGASACSDDPAEPEPDPAPVVAEVRLAVDTLALYAGESGSLGATARDSAGVVIDTAIVFSVSDADVLSVDADGRFDALAHGTATVTASVGEVSQSIPVRVTRFTDIASMYDPICAADADGVTYCIGTEHRGNEIGPHPMYRAWTAVSGDVELTGLTAGRYHTCGLAGGQAFCFGANNDLQMGPDVIGYAAQPVLADDRSYVALDAGWEYTCGIDGSGAAWCWGRNEEHELGIGESSLSAVATVVAGGHSWRMIDAGDAGTCGVATDGLTYCWGSMNGDSVPAAVAGVPAGLDFVRTAWKGACGAQAEEIHCWGEDGGWFPEPAQVTMPAAVLDIAMAADVACALLANGEIRCWGNDSSGLLGVGGATALAVPTPVSSDEHFVRLTGYQERFCALTAGGAVHCWGAGHRSDYPIPPSDVPDRVPAPRP